MGLMLLSAGCASHAARPGESYSIATGEKALAAARNMIGRPYRFRGETPEGFDCSGLVRYSYLAAGMNLPHGTGPLRKVSRPVTVRDLEKGDLLFFDQSGKKYSHVGISAGDTKFIHAPSSGKKVRMDSIQDAYWKKHFLEARRP
jgi:cell wall-associated NlpC family hydrolase